MVRLHKTGAPTVRSIDDLPHREPFRFVTSVSGLTGRDTLTGQWHVSGDEDFFRGHFPDCPIVPGVLLGEALAQLSGLHGIPQEHSSGRLAHVDVKFPASVVPPAVIELESTLRRAMGGLYLFDVRAKTDEVVVAIGSLTLSHQSES